ncbi:hypothetical protein PM082_020053 [Marasmius tenuissimus]|nr:hypothetical protein PM082_020053 [Marasmius tenuissimus]
MTKNEIRAVLKLHDISILQFKYVPPRKHDYGAFAQITFENADKAVAVKEACGGRMYMRYNFPLPAKEATSKLLLVGVTPDNGARNIMSIFRSHSAHI